jgi:hypothetical protein
VWTTRAHPAAPHRRVRGPRTDRRRGEARAQTCTCSIPPARRGVPSGARGRRPVPHPTHIAYHPLWRDDSHGDWIPVTVPTDQESCGWATTQRRAYRPMDVLTRQNAAHRLARARHPGDHRGVWKHGSLPRGIIEITTSSSSSSSTSCSASLSGQGRRVRLLVRPPSGLRAGACSATRWTSWRKGRIHATSSKRCSGSSGVRHPYSRTPPRPE